MADLPQLLNVNPLDWTTTSFTPEDGQLFYFHSHPDFDGIVHVIGDGTSAFDDLHVYADFGNGGTELSEGRKALDERITDALSLSSDDWVTIAEYPEGDVVGFGASFFVDGGDGRIMHFHCEFRNNAGAIEIFGDGADFVRLKGARIAYNNSSASTGAKIQVLCDDSITVISTQMQQFSSKTPALSLVEATDTDNDLVPSGASASFLVAGAYLDCSEDETLIGIVRRNASTQIVVTLPWDDDVYPGANTITPVIGGNLYVVCGGVQTELDLTFTYSILKIYKRRVLLSVVAPSTELSTLPSSEVGTLRFNGGGGFTLS